MNPRNIFQLARKASIARGLASKLAQPFGGAAAHHDDHHGDSHGHGGHGYEVHLERDVNLIANTDFVRMLRERSLCMRKYVVPDQQSDLVAIYGFKDAHQHEHHDDTDPFGHLRHASFFSFERLYLADPYYHDDAHESLMNEPHGYLTCDDPMDTRPNIERTTLELMFLMTGAAVITLMFGYQAMNMVNPSESFFNMNVAAEEIEDKIRQIRISNENLEKKKAELEEQLASL